MLVSGTSVQTVGELDGEVLGLDVTGAGVAGSVGDWVGFEEGLIVGSPVLRSPQVSAQIKETHSINAYVTNLQRWLDLL